MTHLSEQQIKFYDEKGYIAPIDVLSRQEANEIRQEIDTIEKKWPNALEGIGRNYVHLISPVFNKVCLNNKILDAVESIIGKNILICGTTLFIKNSNEKGFVSFHQDAKYIGLEPHNWVTAWIAVTDSNEENGCMRMWSGSHKENLKNHEQKFELQNLFFYHYFYLNLNHELQLDDVVTFVLLLKLQGLFLLMAHFLLFALL